MTQQDPASNPDYEPSLKVVHWMFLLMATAIIALSFTMSSNGGSRVILPGLRTPLPEMCGTKAYFGISCPGCGLTRSFISISHGQFSRAWNLNPASLLVYVFVVIQIPWQIFQLWRIRCGKPIIDSMWVFAPLIVCALALFIQWAIKLSSGIWVT